MQTVKNISFTIAALAVSFASVTVGVWLILGIVGANR